MTLEDKIFSKLAPHAKRIQAGDGNDFDYLPAVLLQLIEEQIRQARLLDGSAKSLGSLNTTVDTIGSQNKEQIISFRLAMDKKMERSETAIIDTQTRLQNSQAFIGEQITVLATASAAHSKQINEGLSAIDLQIKLFASNNQQFNKKLIRFFNAGLVASAVIIGLAIAILQRN